MLSQTSVLLRLRIEVEPKSVLHTSPVMFGEAEKMFISRYPIARAPTDIIATAASPFIFVFCPVLSRRIAQTTVMHRTRGILFVSFKTAAIDIAPNAT